MNRTSSLTSTANSDGERSVRPIRTSWTFAVLLISGTAGLLLVGNPCNKERREIEKDIRFASNQERRHTSTFYPK